MTWVGLGTTLLCSMGAWVRWLTSENKFPDPSWRTGVAFFGLLCGSVSMLLFAAFFTAAWHLGPFKSLAIRSQALAYLDIGLALLGFLSGAIGKGKTRVGALGAGLMMIITWCLLLLIGATA